MEDLEHMYFKVYISKEQIQESWKGKLRISQGFTNDGYCQQLKIASKSSKGSWNVMEEWIH